MDATHFLTATHGKLASWPAHANSGIFHAEHHSNVALASSGRIWEKTQITPVMLFPLASFMRILTVCEMLVLLVPCHTRIILARLLPETSVSSVGSHTSGTDGCIRM